MEPGNPQFVFLIRDGNSLFLRHSAGKLSYISYSVFPRINECPGISNTSMFVCLTERIDGSKCEGDKSGLITI